jgi:hypothetical protein
MIPTDNLEDENEEIDTAYAISRKTETLTEKHDYDDVFDAAGWFRSC